MYQDTRRLDFHALGREIKRKRKAKGWTQEYLAQLVERVRRYRHILLQPLDGRVAHAVLEPQRIGRRSLQFHRFPQRRIANHTKAPFTGFIMTAIMAIPIWLLFSHAGFF